MSENEVASDEKYWKGKLREHKNALIILIIAGICVFIGFILVMLWVIEANPFVDPRTGTFNSWTLNYVVGIMILMVLWELLLVGAPAALFFCLGGYLWWRGLPAEEKQEMKERDKKKRSHKAEKYGGGGGGFSFVMFIAYCIYIAVEGNYNAQFGSRSYTYWLYSYMITFMWIFIVLGLPCLIALIIWYLVKGRKK